MNEADLDRAYTALAHALADVGEERSELMLAMLALALIARAGDADTVLPLIAQARDKARTP
ncbi:hypothetical protein LZ009_12615 [Ramlibacter sp. XY19]|uniref:hypothetical protein n=1 Tax=Ramlibacter paludis TaxID=2908000 RepID=UPI0023DBBAF2|nr:hypothetical protein [Ramlibacter paludis]MCG2593621.1 hypothetical protein [Ramlibacter paludis]